MVRRIGGGGEITLTSMLRKFAKLPRRRKHTALLYHATRNSSENGTNKNWLFAGDAAAMGGRPNLKRVLPSPPV